jgi:hypothetical protein
MEKRNRRRAPPPPAGRHPPLDWSDPAAVSHWVESLRVAFHDADAVTLDMLKPPRARELGPVLHARNYGEARAAVLAALAAARAPVPTPSDPPPR